MDSRPDFPFSATLMRNYVYSVKALGETIKPADREKIIKFTKKIQQPDGGFSIDAEKKVSSTLYTYYALETLAYLGAVNSIDTGKAKAYLLSLRQSDSGFGFDARAKESSLATTYFAVRSLYLLNGLQSIDKAKTTAYIEGFEVKSTGGFNYVRKTGTASAKNTYMATYVLYALGTLDSDIKKNSVKYLQSTLYTGKAQKYKDTQTLEEQAYTIKALKILGSEKTINSKGVVSFIKMFYIPANGGFGPVVGYGSAPDPTYFALQGLAEIGTLKLPAEVALK
jgi:prenyltransferase beta subunit